jgi:hypothetical protein
VLEAPTARIRALTGKVKCYFKCPVIRLTKQVKFIEEECKTHHREKPHGALDNTSSAENDGCSAECGM